jgi:hypothetical protein
MSNVDDTEKTTCPICEEQEMVEHCESITCLWTKCRNSACQAVLDLGQAIGYKHNPKTPEKRTRLVLSDEGEWRERIEG